jgi:hypothetical protein
MNNTTIAPERLSCIRFVRRWWPPYLHREIEQLGKIHRMACVEWAEDHTHLQTLCRAAGCTEDEVEGSKYGVPGIMELADLLRDKLSPPNASDQMAASEKH